MHFCILEHGLLEDLKALVLTDTFQNVIVSPLALLSTMADLLLNLLLLAVLLNFFGSSKSNAFIHATGVTFGGISHGKPPSWQTLSHFTTRTNWHVQPPGSKVKLAGLAVLATICASLLGAGCVSAAVASVRIVNTSKSDSATAMVTLSSWHTKP